MSQRRVHQGDKIVPGDKKFKKLEIKGWEGGRSRQHGGMDKGYALVSERSPYSILSFTN